MANDGNITFDVVVDAKRAKTDIKDITKTIEKETKKWDDAAEQSTSNIEKSFKSLLKKLVAGFSAIKIGKALLDIGKDAIEAASDLQEVQNVVDVTFGKSAGVIDDWAKNAIKQYGLTETQAKRFASTMGAMMKSSGLAGTQIVSMSTDLAGLAADMASFYNLDFDTAFQKIRSGISGETEPLKQLGINMSVANLNAFALQQGLGKTFEEMTQGEQVMLRYQYLMQATADAQGDFARTSDNYANSTRLLESQIDQLKTTIGSFLVGKAADMLAWANELIGLLIPEEKPHTVLDDFNEIDLQTEAKLQQIRETAEEATLLTEQLETIAGSKADQAGGKVQQIADGLAAVDLDKGKAKAVKDFISVLAENVDVIAAIQGSSADEAAKWLETIGTAASNLDPNDAEGWKTLMEEIRTGLPGFENTNFGAAFLNTLGGNFDTAADKTSVMMWAVEQLGDKTDRTAQEQKLWLETCKRLVQTIPGLSSIINAETGEIKGGTQAVKDYIKAWEEGQTKLAMLGALEQKEAAYAKRFENLPELELDMAIARRRVRLAKEQLLKHAEERGIVTDIYDLDNPMSMFPLIGQAQTDEDWVNEVKYYYTLVGNMKDATQAYIDQKKALEEAKLALEEARVTIDEMPGSIDDATDAMEEWSEEAKAAAGTIIDAVDSAVKELADYVQSVHDSVAGAVESTFKGFELLESPMMKSAKRMKEITTEIAGLDTTTSDYTATVEKLNAEFSQLEGQKITAQGMAFNLEENAKFLDSYMEALDAARAAGISDDVLAELADGSLESYDYIVALAGATAPEVERINAAYDALTEKKGKLTDELTAQKLTVDEVYQEMAAKAKEAVDALDLGEEAAENSGKTIEGIAQGIAGHVPEVATQVDAIIEQLERLNGFGINVDFGGFGEINFKTNVGKDAGAEGSSRMGLDYVPHDDYIARLHEGEKVLTAQEASIYRGLANGSIAGVDLDALGGVMHDSIQPGGNVYLDGKIVGAVVSDRQGRSYKSLQRSGWQA